MKKLKLTALLFFSFLAVMSTRAVVLFQDSTNYPYADGCIEGQGQWYCYYPATPQLNAFVTNNVLLLTANSTNDAVATPTNGWVNPGEYNYASFTINVSQLPTGNGTYFCQFQNINDTNDCCHVFIDTTGTVVPGTYRLGIANYDTSVSTVVPPVNYPLDLATGITYTVVMLFDTNQNNTTFVGSTLWINPSEQDYENVVDGDDISPGIGDGFVYGTDTTLSQSQLNINISQIGFSPYAYAGISKVIIGTTFNDVNSTNLPVIGVQPQSGTNYYGNSTVFYTAASGVDLTYQWWSQYYGKLVDGTMGSGLQITGSTSNILVLNNLQTTDTYYCVVADTYGNTTNSATATNTVIITPTAPFFPPAAPGQASSGGLNLTNNLFTSFGLTNLANGTGPLTYQWYFAPTNTPATFTSLGGQTSSGLFIPELEYPNAGNYYVLATGPDGVTAGPTNSLTVVPPVVATLPQLHELMGLLVTNITGNNTVPINTNGVSVSGYVSVFGPLSASTKTYAEFYITYSNYGTYVFFNPSGHTNQIPAPGSYVTVFGAANVFDGQLEIDPGTVTVSNTPSLQMPAPQLCNVSNFNTLATNSLSPYGVQVQCSLVTFTNVYIYGSRTGGVIGNGGKFFTNGFTSLYMTEGPYSAPNNTNTIEIFVPAYGFGYTTTNLWGAVVPTYCYQITGILAAFHSGAALFSELDVTRLQDFVTNAPTSFTAGLTQSNRISTITWPAQTGSTYSVYSASNLLGSWRQTFGLSYYPSTGTYTDTNRAAAQFYKISSP